MRLYLREGRVWYCAFVPIGAIKEVRLSTDIEVGKDRDASREKAQLKGVELAKAYNQKNDSSPTRETVNSRTRANLAWALEQTWQRRWKKSKSAITLKHVIPRLQQEIGHWLLHEIDFNLLDNYFSKLVFDAEDNPNGIAPATINRRRSYIHKAMSDAVNRGELSRMPQFPQVLREENEKDRQMWPTEEAAMLEWFDRMALDDHKDKREEWVYIKNLTVFLIDTGFRFSEVFKFNLQENTYACLPPITKNGKPRRIPLTRRAMEAVKYIMASPRWSYTVSEDVIATRWDFCSYRFDRCMTETAINRADTPTRDKVTLHILRHTTASRLISKGVSLMVVKEWMGHKSIKTTMRYAHLAPATLAGALSVLEGGPVAVVNSLTDTRALPEGNESSDIRHSG